MDLGTEMLLFNTSLGGASSPVLTPMPASVVSMVGIGDSYMAGSAGVSDPAHGFLSLMGARLGATVLNQGVPGSTLQNGWLQAGVPQSGWRTVYTDAAQGLINANKRELAVINPGYNDARYTADPTNLNPTNYGKMLGQMIDGLIAMGYPRNRILSVAFPWVPDTTFANGTTGFTGQTRAGYESYVAVHDQVCQAKGIYNAKLYPYTRDHGGASLMAGDGVHYNDAGNIILADAGMAALRYPSPTVAPLFLVDNFTDIDGTAITAHVPDVGDVWEAYAQPASPNTINANRMWAPTNAGIYSCLTPTPSADGYAEIDLDYLSTIAGDQVGVGFRMQLGANTYIWGRYARAAGGLQMEQTINGTATLLGSFAFTFSSGSRTMRLTVAGDQASMQLDGVTVIPPVTVGVTVAAGYAPGCAGVRMTSVQTATTGVQVSAIRASA